MPDRYIPRGLEPVLRRAAREFPAVVLTGPRQSGKTTLLARIFNRSHRYVSLEPPDVRASAASDPRGFLEAHPPPVIFDEVQYAPDLLPYIKEQIDGQRHRKGRYLLTGSQNLLLSQRVTESLAGRVAVLRLFPLSRREVRGRALDEPAWERTRPPAAGAVAATRPARAQLWADLLRGGFPELAVDPRRDFRLWHASYGETHLERDVRALRQIGDLTQFHGFLRMLAARSAQLLNLADLGRDLGIAANTIRGWISVLEATHQIVILRPYFANVGKRLVKTPKVFFTDTGTLCHLAGLKDPEHAAAGPMGGAILETAVLSEILKAQHHRGLTPQAHFWRTATGGEVDFVVERNGKLIPIEVKLTATPRPPHAAGIAAFRRDLGDAVSPGFVVHTGDARTPLGPDARALPFGDL